MASAGIITTAVVVGLYKKSVTAGFKTLLMLICTFGGAVTVVTCLYLANKIFHFDLARVTIAWAGLAGGLIGGILLSLIIISIIRFVLARIMR